MRGTTLGCEASGRVDGVIRTSYVWARVSQLSFSPAIEGETMRRRTLLAAVFVLAGLGAAAASPWSEAQFGDKAILLHPKCQPLSTSLMGPFVKLGDGSLLAVDADRVMVSTDAAQTWSARPLFAQPEKYQCRDERALLRTRDGTLILAFLNEKERVFRWDQSRGGPLPGCRLPVYVTRSTDEGNSWHEPEVLQEGYCGAIRSMIQLRSGRVVLGCQEAVSDPGRHICFTYASEDEGQTWKRSNVIDLGGHRRAPCAAWSVGRGGYGDHGGGIEPTLAQLQDGRVWMLIRTYRGCFSQAFSADEGLTWEDVRPSEIEASGSPGELRRLQSGRLVL